MVTFDVVYHLNKGAIGFRQMIEDEWARGFDNGKPLPRRATIGGELAKEGMAGIHEQAERAGTRALLIVLTDGFEHAVVPIVGLKESAYRITRNQSRVGHKQYTRPTL